MKKILIISSGYTPIIDNNNGAIQNLIKLYLLHNSKTNKFDVVVYSAKNKNNKPDPKDAIKNTEFRTIDISQRKDGCVFKFLRFCSILFGTTCARGYIKEVLSDLNCRNELDKFDLIIVENCVNDLAYIGKHLKTKAPIVLHLHNDYLGKERADAKKATEYLSQVWCVSNYLRDRVNEIDPEADKAITIYNTIDMGNFRKKLPKKERMNIRSQLGFKKDDFVFVYVGRVMKEKGVLPLVKAFNNLSAYKDKVRLLIIGDKKNPDIKDAYYNKFLHIIKRNDRIKHLGRIDNNDLYKYYQISNCQMIPSKWQEALGLVALEGKVSNLRIISTGSGGLKEVLDQNDIIIKDLKPKTLESAMKGVLKATKNRTINPKYIFSRENFTSNIDNAIEKITNSKNGRKA